MARKKREAEKTECSLTAEDKIMLLAMNAATAVTLAKTVQLGFSNLITAMGARPDLSAYPDPMEMFMSIFDEMTGEDEEEIPEADDEGATTGS